MARSSNAAFKPPVHTPILVDWTDEKLGALDQDQLLNLLESLDRQRASGRLREEAAAPLELRITALLTGRSRLRRRKLVARTAEA